MTLGLGLMLGGCIDKGDDDGPSAGDDATTSWEDPKAGDEDTTQGGGIPADPGDAADDGDPTTGIPGAFIVEPDGGGSAIECDLWNQDCPEGKKCMPWANDGGNAWNAARCSDVAAEAKLPGEECTVISNASSGEDNCERAAACWNVNSETQTGTCVSLCTGSPDAPTCDDPGTACTIANEGTLILCLPTCDPLAQDCAPQEACYPVRGQFSCAPDRSAEGAGEFGSPCEYINACRPGLFCVGAAGVPGCTGTACCTHYCDRSAADPNTGCQGEGQTCEAWFDPGSEVPGLEDLGACLVAQ